MEVIIALILSIALEFNIPPYFALSIAYIENETLDPLAVNVNKNGTRDLGVMQVNSSWFKGDWKDPEINIRAGCQYLTKILGMPEISTYWQAAICYNAGTAWLQWGSPPTSSLTYADKVIDKWNELTKGRALTVIGRERWGYYQKRGQ